MPSQLLSGRGGGGVFQFRFQNFLSMSFQLLDTNQKNMLTEGQWMIIVLIRFHWFYKECLKKRSHVAKIKNLWPRRDNKWMEKHGFIRYFIVFSKQFNLHRFWKHEDTCINPDGWSIRILLDKLFFPPRVDGNGIAFCKYSRIITPWGIINGDFIDQSVSYSKMKNEKLTLANGKMTPPPQLGSRV